MKIREILCNMFQDIEVGYDKKDDRFTGINILTEKSINRCLAAIQKELIESMPKKKQVRYETNQRKMGLDGRIITTDTQIKYDKEEEAYNQCLSEVLEVIKRECDDMLEDGEGWQYCKCHGFNTFMPKEKVFTINIHY